MIYILLGVFIMSGTSFGQQKADVNSNSILLWQIGKGDGDDSDLALGPKNYPQYSDDGVYIVGRSDCRRSWPYVQPGPDDSWAGSRVHTGRILFGLQTAPQSGQCHVSVRLIDTQSQVATVLRVQVNSWKQEVQMPLGNGDESLNGEPSKGSHYHFSLDVPVSALKTGVNEVSIATIRGSWIIYDSIDMDAPKDAQTMAISPYWYGSALPTQFLVHDGDGESLSQIVKVSLWNFADPTDAEMRINGTTRIVHLAYGVNNLEFRIPAVKTDTSAELTTTIGGKQVAETSVTLRPVRHWEVYVVPHSHVDIGYTNVQAMIRVKQVDNLRGALDQIRKTADYPKDSQFKWNLEVMWPIDDYLRDATPAQKKEFFDAVRSGSIGLNAYYGNLLTGLASSIELLHASDASLLTAHQAGTKLQCVMQDDTPGYTWGNIAALAEAGVKYWSLGPNYRDRIGSTLIRWHDKPFYWVSQSGKEKVLAWMCYDGYALGTLIGEKLPPFLPNYLDNLDRDHYPYDIVSLQWTVNGDNGSPDLTLSDTVRDWNAKYVYPHLIIAETSEPFIALEKRYGDKIPSYSGDFTPYWEDGAGSTSLETKMNRASTSRLAQAEALWAMRSAMPFPADSFRSAWDNALLYSEHTWGAWNSTSDPDAPSVRAQWDGKRAFARNADKESSSLLEQAAGGNVYSSSIEVYNTESWTRSDIVLVPKNLSSKGDLVKDSSGKSVPSQRLASGELAVLALDLPPFSSRRYTISSGKAHLSGSAAATHDGLSNGALDLKVNPSTGAISELHAKGIPGNLVDAKSRSAVNDYFYLIGGDLKDLQKNGPVSIKIEDAGPLVATLSIRSDAPGCRSLTRKVRLISGIQRVDIADTVDKLAVRDKEGMHFGFGFNIPNPVTRMDMPLSVVRPELDQLPAANKNWYPVQHWVDISNNDYGVTWATLDAPLVEVGDITAGFSTSSLRERSIPGL
jgi:hypothetical protein